MANPSIPEDYLERVYAGVLGKLVGVYLGRPFEQWTHERILCELGPIEGYVHDRLNQPLVVTDDDVAGTFTFIRALEDYGCSPSLRSEDIGRAWLNYIVEGRSILWWGGNGNSTEHTAWLNLKRGVLAPASGSALVNGQTVAEQIGAQIFIDGWAMVAPGQPALAARLAGAAGRVSHDGESVHAAQLWAAMEAEAFLSRDIDHLIDTGLAQIPSGCLIARLVADIRAWHRAEPDWRVTRQRIDEAYGYHRFPGSCHVVPNHALMIMAVLYAPDDFRRAQMIVNTSGWDTDCNAGNVGCLMGLMLGREAIDRDYDFTGPLADRMLVSSADGGGAVTDALRTACYLASLGRRLAGLPGLAAPKAGAQFHFSLPGSRQGFLSRDGDGLVPAQVENLSRDGSRGLAIGVPALGPGQSALVTTPTFAPPEVVAMRTYELMASPRVVPGQVVSARVTALSGPMTLGLAARAYGAADRLETLTGPQAKLAPGAGQTLTWRVPDTGGQPIAELGLAVLTEGQVQLDWLRWDGAPDFCLRRPPAGDFWRRAWVNAADVFGRRQDYDFHLSQARGDGMVLYGSRDWRDYEVETDLTLHLGARGGLLFRVQGLHRHCALVLLRSGAVQILSVRDETTRILAEASLPVPLDQPVPVRLTVCGQTVLAEVAGLRLKAVNDDWTEGGIGLVVREGALSTGPITIRPGVEGKTEDRSPERT